MAFQLLQLGGTGIAHTPDSAGLSISDNLDLRIRVLADDWDGFLQTFIDKRQSDNEWQFRTHFSGSQLLSLVWWDTGGTDRTVVADESLGFTDGTTHWVRVRKSAGSVDFYKSDDDTNDHTAVSWTQVGTTQSTSTNDIRSDVSTNVVVGGQGLGAGEPFYGFVYAAAIVDDTTTIAAPVFADSTEWTVGDTEPATADDAQGNTWTLGGQAHIIGDNIHGVYLGLQAAFGNNPFDASKIWTHITDDLRSVDFERGRQYELDRIEAGTMRAVLSNNSGQYNANNTASPHYPNVKPSVPIRLRAVHSGTIYPLWQGFVERWPMSFPGKADSIVEVDCVDLFKFLSLAEAETEDRATAVDALTPVAYWRLTDSSDGTGTGHTLTANGGLSFGGAAGAWQDDDATTFDGSNDYCTVASEADVELQGADRSWEAWVNPSSSGSGSGYVVDIRPSGAANSEALVTLAYDYTDTQFFTTGLGTGGASATQGDWHHVVVTYSVSGGNYTQRIYLNGSQVGSTYTAAEPTGTFDVRIGRPAGFSEFFQGDVSEVAVYNTELSASQIASLFVATSEAYIDERTDERIDYIMSNFSFPVSPTLDLQTGQTTMDGANSPTGQSILAAIQTAAETENGAAFMAGDGSLVFHDRDYRSVNQSTSSATFDGGANRDYFDVTLGLDDERIYNDVRVAPDDTTSPFIVRDTDSIESHGRRLFERTIYPATANEALDAANWLLGNFKQANIRIGELVLRLGDDTGLWSVVLGAEIGNRYTLTHTMTGDNYSEDHHLESVAHSISASGLWEVRWRLSPAIDQTVWILGDDNLSLLGDTTILGY